MSEEKELSHSSVMLEGDFSLARTQLFFLEGKSFSTGIEDSHSYSSPWPVVNRSVQQLSWYLIPPIVVSDVLISGISYSSLHIETVYLNETKHSTTADKQQQQQKSLGCYNKYARNMNGILTVYLGKWCKRNESWC